MFFLQIRKLKTSTGKRFRQILGWQVPSDPKGISKPTKEDRERNENELGQVSLNLRSLTPPQDPTHLSGTGTGP